MSSGLRAIALGIVVILELATTANAQIVAPAGRTLFNRGVLFRSLVRYDAFEETRSGENIERWRSINAVVWGAYPHLSLSLVTPLVRVERSDRNSSAARTIRSGRADSTIFARYDLLRRNVRAGTTRLAPEIGVKLPTGGSFSTNSTDLIAGLVFSHIRDPHWIVTDVQITRRGSGDDGLRSGDRSRFDFAYLHRIHPRGGPGEPMTLAVIELNVESAGRSEVGGVVTPDTGGTVVFVSPGIEFLLSRRFVLELSLPVPVLVELNGSQPEAYKTLSLTVVILKTLKISITQVVLEKLKFRMYGVSLFSTIWGIH